MPYWIVHLISTISKQTRISISRFVPSPPPLSQRERGDKRLPRPLGEGRGEGDLVVAPKS